MMTGGHNRETIKHHMISSQFFPVALCDSIEETSKCQPQKTKSNSAIGFDPMTAEERKVVSIILALQCKYTVS